MEVIIFILIVWFIGSVIFKDGDAKYKKRWPYTVKATEFLGAAEAKEMRDMMKKGLKNKETARQLDDVVEPIWWDYFNCSPEERELKALNKKLSDLERKLR